MSEEEARKIVDTIKQEEFPYALAIAKAYEKLQKENENLKQINEEHRELNGELRMENKEFKRINNSLLHALSLSRQKYNNDKQRYRRKYKKEHNILTEFEKWLESLNRTVDSFAIKVCLDKLQELKEGNNAKI